MKITIVGAGAIGGVIGAYLVKGGIDVTFLDVAEDHIRKMQSDGLTIQGNVDAFTVPVKAFTLDEFVTKNEKLDAVFLCVKAQHTKAAVKSFKHMLDEKSCVVSFQNGLCEQEIAEEIGYERTIGCFVNLFADYQEPGVIQYGGVGSVYIGELDGVVSERVTEIVSCLSLWGKAKATQNILGYLWGKIGYGAVLTATAVTNETIADVLDSVKYRKMLLHIATEIFKVAESQGVTPEGFDDWEPSLIYPERSDQLNEQLDKLVKRLRGYTKTRTGIWRDLAVRKRKTEVPNQLLPVIDEGEKQGFDMTLTKLIVKMIQEIENGERQMSIENLDELLSVFEYQIKGINQV